MSTDDQGSSGCETKEKQLKLSDCRSQSPSQGKVGELIINVIVGNMSSLRVVECPQFRTLITSLAPHASVRAEKLCRNLKCYCRYDQFCRKCRFSFPCPFRATTELSDVSKPNNQPASYAT